MPVPFFVKMRVINEPNVAQKMRKRFNSSKFNASRQIRGRQDSGCPSQVFPHGTAIVYRIGLR
jgi:hypothetical protein